VRNSQPSTSGKTMQGQARAGKGRQGYLEKNIPAIMSHASHGQAAKM
jgi:hypothetical protein